MQIGDDTIVRPNRLIQPSLRASQEGAPSTTTRAGGKGYDPGNLTDQAVSPADDPAYTLTTTDPLPISPSIAKENLTRSSFVFRSDPTIGMREEVWCLCMFGSSLDGYALG